MVVSIFVDDGLLPVGIVKIRLFEANFACFRMVFFKKLCLITGCSASFESGMDGAFEGCIGGHDILAVNSEIENQSMAIVARDPYAVDKTLVIRVYSDCIPPFYQIIRNIDFIVEVVKRIASSGALVDEFSVDVQLVVVVGGDENSGVIRRIQRERFSEEDMLVSGLLVFRLEFRGCELSVEDVKRLEIGQ